VSDLAAFLRARLADDERYIRAMQAAGERFRGQATPAKYDRDTPFMQDAINGILDDKEAVAALTAVQAAGAPNDLARLLREVEAKRRIIIHAQAAEQDVPDIYAYDLAADYVLRALASVYSGHPDYDPEWTMDG